MPSFVNRRMSKAAAATTLGLMGLPVAAAGYLRLKYGATVFDDLVKIWWEWNHEKAVQRLQKRKVKVVDFFEEHARQTPEKAFVLYKDEVLTYGDTDKEANKLARFLRRSAVADSGDTVGIFMQNEPGFVISWLAFNKLGLQMAFLNCNLRGDTLLHCIKACKVKAIISGTETTLLGALEAILPDLQSLNVTVWVLGKFQHQAIPEAIPEGMVHVKTWNERSDPIPRSVRDSLSYDADSLYIFTSGTTGLPKPAKIPHFRQVRSSFVHLPLGLSKEDVMYTTLPLYHSGAFLIGFINAVRVGCTIALSNFSTRRFWDDIRKYRATVFQYIGEICRYLLAQPPRSDDGKYSQEIRYAIGNGLRPDIWEAFQKRFSISRVVEIYGATELPYLSLNLDGKLGSAGRYHGIIRALGDLVVLVQCDLETAQPLRGPDGNCLLTPPGETGLLLIRLGKLQFQGYLGNKSANEKKLVRNVKQKDDLFVNTGDLMVHDKDGYLFFKDRLGDTFRWKGENVATTEVAHVLNQYPGVQDANVYGVQVSGHDGRAGMAAIVLLKDRQLDLKGFYDHVVKELPLYACPKFLRIMDEMDITDTFKHKKTDLAKEGFDPNVVSDPLFFMDTERKTYAPLDKDAMRKVVVGQARL